MCLLGVGRWVGGRGCNVKLICCEIKDINSVNTNYSDWPSLGYKEQYSKLIPIMMYNTFDTSLFFLQSFSLRLTGQQDGGLALCIDGL